jgi:hypothetical protein
VNICSKKEHPFRYEVSTMFRSYRTEKGSVMLTVALSLLFGLVAFAALAQIRIAVGAGLERWRSIGDELSRLPPIPIRSLSSRPLDLRPAAALAAA